MPRFAILHESPLTPQPTSHALAEISTEKCKLAVAVVNGPTLVEDTSLCYNALGGLPGPYIKWFLDKTGHEGLNNLLAAYTDKSAYSQCVFSLQMSPDDEPITFVGRCEGTIVPAAGPTDFGWDPIFAPDGEGGLTFAQIAKARKNVISHRAKALEKVRAFLPTLLRKAAP